MERKEIRGALACLSYAAEVNEDDDLATILNVVHAAIIHNDAHRLVKHLDTYKVLVYHGNDDPPGSCLPKQVGPLEYVLK